MEKKVLKKGKVRFYFPEHPHHPFNGAAMASCSAYTGHYQGLKCRNVIEAFEDNYRNNHYSDGYWEGTVTIKAKDFKADKVLVYLWSANGSSERFYLSNHG